MFFCFVTQKNIFEDVEFCDEKNFTNGKKCIMINIIKLTLILKN